MKITNLILFIVLINSNLNGQALPVTNTILNDKIEGFEFIDAEIEGVRLVGAGEATHGTKEFKIIQCNLFKYLVKNHDYTTFFLEDEYVYCLPIDRYIKGESGNVDSLVAGLRNWPWKTPQLKSLISWMKSYNEMNGNVLSFVGVDFQDHKELKLYLESEFKIKAIDKDLTEIITLLKNSEKRSQSNLLLPSLKEWSNGERKRDAAMAQLIIKYLEQEEQSKGVFCAHNTHLLKIYVDKKNDKKDFALAGGLLDHILKEQYYVLATDFDEGAFYAHALKNDRLSKKKISNHEFKVNNATCPNQKFSLCKYLKDENSEVLFMSDLQEHKWIHVNDVGAVYYRKKNGKKSKYTSQYLKPDYLDSILFFKTTSAATILGKS